MNSNFYCTHPALTLCLLHNNTHTQTLSESLTSLLAPHSSHMQTLSLSLSSVCTFSCPLHLLSHTHSHALTLSFQQSRSHSRYEPLQRSHSHKGRIEGFKYKHTTGRRRLCRRCRRCRQLAGERSEKVKVHRNKSPTQKRPKI